MHNGLPHTVPMTPMEWLGVSEEWYRLGDHWETGSESDSSISTTCSDLDGWEIVEPMSEVAIPLGDRKLSPVGEPETATTKT